MQKADAARLQQEIRLFETIQRSRVGDPARETGPDPLACEYPSFGNTPQEPDDDTPRWQHKRFTDVAWEDYDPMLTADLEDAHAAGKRSIEIYLAGGTFVVDFHDMVMKNARNPRRMREVRRLVKDVETRGARSPMVNVQVKHIKEITRTGLGAGKCFMSSAGNPLSQPKTRQNFLQYGDWEPRVSDIREITRTGLRGGKCHMSSAGDPLSRPKSSQTFMGN